jgi:hypothetical protein
MHSHPLLFGRAKLLLSLSLRWGPMPAELELRRCQARLGFLCSSLEPAGGRSGPLLQQLDFVGV